MPEAVRVYIERVKAALAVTTDEELAAKIGYSKQSIANWRRRNGVPNKAELRIVGILGADFVIRKPSTVSPRAKWDDIVHGLAVFAVDLYIAHCARPLPHAVIRAIGWRFDELEGELRKLVLAYSATYPQDVVFDAVVRVIEKRQDRKIDELLASLATADILRNEVGLVP